jgi:cytochrome c peroxidase
MPLKKIIITFFLLVVLASLFSNNDINLNNLPNYSSQPIPSYITKDNTPLSNPLTNSGATLGRVLFYDKRLSLNESISCASCHNQQFAFSDTASLSVGFDGGLTSRHSMRLINTRFSLETNYFWNERANSLEEQTIHPIKDHVEMGFSGTNGQPPIDSLISRLSEIGYYKPLFQLVYGDTTITSTRIQFALSQFIRSIVSFDSKYDTGRALVNSDSPPFPNFTNDENEGKKLFLNHRPLGANCQQCHLAPEFDIIPSSRNNGVIGVAGNSSTLDLNNTKSPSLRDLFNSRGTLNGPLMHNGAFSSLEEVLEHYNKVPNDTLNTNIDSSLIGPGSFLALNNTKKNQLTAFLKTLTGSNVYMDKKWSNPFDSTGNITIIPLVNSITSIDRDFSISLYPNPTSSKLFISVPNHNGTLLLYNSKGAILQKINFSDSSVLDVSTLSTGVYVVVFKDEHLKKSSTKYFIKE